LLYYYGKYVVKAMAVETNKQLKITAKKPGKVNRKNGFKVDKGYLGSGIGALEECLRVCLPERHRKVNFYIGYAYKILNMPLKTFSYWKVADERLLREKTLSMH
jgi:hypothetical protein